MYLGMLEGMRAANQEKIYESWEEGGLEKHKEEIKKSNDKKKLLDNLRAIKGECDTTKKKCDIMIEIVRRQQ